MHDAGLWVKNRFDTMAVRWYGSFIATGRAQMHLKSWSNPEWKGEDWMVVDAAPKAVLYEIARRMAVCVHGSSCDSFREMAASVIKEWEILNINEIVPQKPPKALLALKAEVLAD
jgi:hypothetical protein